MKKLILLTVLIFPVCMAAHAQYADRNTTQSILRQGGNLYTLTGVRLDNTSASGILAPDAYRQFRTGRSLYISGIAVSAAGGAFFVGGTASLIAGIAMLGHNNSSCTPPGLLVMNAGYLAIITGGALTILSIPLYCIGISLLNKASRSASPQGTASAPQLSLGARSGGIGLGITF